MGANKAESRYTNDELECINGTYFHKKTGTYVPLSGREVSTEPERRLRDVSGVVDVGTVGFSYWFVYVPSTFDSVEDVRSIFKDIYGSVSLMDRYEHTYTGRGHDEVLKFKVG